MKPIQAVRRSAAIVLAALCLVSQAGAHSAPEEARPFYGGIAQTTEPFNLELVIEDRRLQLFVRDRHNWPLDIRGADATALVWSGERSMEMGLTPAARGALSGEGEIQREGLERVIVTLRMPGQEPVMAWFRVRRPG